MRVCKFGGAALRSAAAFRQARAIWEADAGRQVMVVSAPGKRAEGDEKITDLLYACQSAAADGRGYGHLFDRAAQRFREIAAELGLPAPDDDLRQVYQGLPGASPAWAASRGEWLCGRLMSRYLELPMIEPERVIRFDAAGRLMAEETLGLLRAEIPGPCVLPGFYGADGAGGIRVFPRGGSDVTAALAAAALNADACENWKDVAGVYAADPRLVPDARPVPDMTYRELRALSLLGAQVLCDEAVAPLRRAGVPLLVRPFNIPEAPGTRVHAGYGPERRASAIAVTGRAGIALRRWERIGGGGALAETALNAGLPLDRLAADADALCLTLRRPEAPPAALDALADRSWRLEHAASVSVVGEGLSRADAAARFTAALSGAGLRPLSLHMPPEGLYITAVVEEESFPTGIRAAYDAFLRA